MSADRIGATRRGLFGKAVPLTNALLATLAACTLPTSPSVAPGTQIGATASRSPVTVELLAGTTPSQAAVLQGLVIDPFEQAHPDIRLVVVEHPPGQYDQKLLSLVSAGVPPDVAYAAPPSLYLGRLTQDLTAVIRRDRYDTGVFVRNAFDSAATWQGRIVGLPYYFGGHSSVLPYNRELFRVVGVPEPPATWGAPGWDAEAWLGRLQRTTRRDADGAVRSYGTNVTFITFYAYYLSSLWNGAWLSEDLHKVTCDSPEMLEALEYFAGLATQHRVMATGLELQQAFGDPNPERAFLNGQLAMYATPGAQNIAAIPPAVRSRGLPLAYAPLPAFKTFGAAHYYLSNGLVAGARHPDAGWTYMKWAAGTPNWCISRGQPPARADLFDVWARSVYDGIDAQMRLDVYRDSLRYPLKLDPLFHVPTVERVQMTDLIQSSLDRLWAGETPAALLLRELRPLLQALLPKNLPA